MTAYAPTSAGELVVRARRFAVGVGHPVDELSDAQVLQGVVRLRGAVENTQAAARAAQQLRVAERLAAERLRLELERRRLKRALDSVQADLRSVLLRSSRQSQAIGTTPAGAAASAERELVRRRDRFGAELGILDALAREFDALGAVLGPVDRRLASLEHA